MAFCNAGIFAQIKFTASVSPATIGKDETAQLTLTIENASQVQSINTPQLKGFTIVGGPSQETSMQSINGSMTQSSSLIYVIKPNAVGRFVIPSTTANADGKTLQSNSVEVTVTKNPTGNGSQNNASSPFSSMPAFSGFDDPMQQTTFNDCILKKGENIQEKVNKNMFIRAETNKTSCYVGEPIVVTYKLYSRLQSESNITQSPSFNGFSVIGVQQPNTANKIAKVNGREYNVYTLLQSQLYPLQSGQLELGSIEMDNTIHFIKAESINRQPNDVDDLFRNFMQTSMPTGEVENHQVTIKSKPVTIDVKPLPDNKPASFKGAVGNFELSSTLDKNNFTTDDAGKLTVTVSGAGNMTLINAPSISWPNGIEAFEPKANEQLNKAQVPVTGNKHFEYAFTASKAGQYILPATEFSFFDPKTSTYKTVSTKPLSISVSPGTTRPVASPENIAVANNSSPGYLRLILEISALLIIAGLFIWSRRENKKRIEELSKQIAIEKTPVTTKNETGLTKNHLALSEEKLLQNENKDFYPTLNKELRDFLAAHFNLPTDEINKKRMADEMDKRNISVVNSLQLQKLMDDIEWHLYTPFADQNKMQEIYGRASTLIHFFNNSSI